VEGRQQLIALGQGVYGVSEVCRILRPSMTPRKVHYWLDTGLIHDVPVAKGSRGHPTLLTFRQLLEIRTVQHLRDELKAPLPKVRDAFAWILQHLFEENTEAIRFTLAPGRRLVAELPSGDAVVVPGGQPVIPWMTERLNTQMHEARQAWTDQRLQLRNSVVADPRVMAGAPTISGTRIETAFIAPFAEENGYTAENVDDVLRAYPRIQRKAVLDAFDFEGIARAS
jgi:uncharacterized protein (DUF433 family)